MSIKDDLITIGAIRIENIDLYSRGTRDNPELEVLFDTESGVIFIPDSDISASVYEEGEYRQSDAPTDYQDSIDTQRRIEDHRELYQDRDIMDFGCGLGSFLRASQPYAQSVVGLELQDSCRTTLNAQNIRCAKSVNEIEDSSLDTIFMFHVLEHISTPLETLAQLFSKLRSGGRLVVEVPSANDFLLTHIGGESFKHFTLWSQHLVLHTRDSLRRLIHHSDFELDVIKNTQRYPIANHLGWLKNGRPGGHVSEFSFLNDIELQRAYSNALAKLDLSDTLTLVATVP